MIGASAPRWRIRSESPAPSVAGSPRSNFGSSPLMVGRKNGADLGAFGASFGLFRFCRR